MMEMQTEQIKPIAETLPEVEIKPGVPEKQQEANTTMRPTSAVSTTSVSSVTSNTKRSQLVQVSKFTIDMFFAHKEGVFDSAVSECKTNVLKPEDGELVGAWLLAEIDQWDCEQEKLVLLTKNSLHVVRYNWVKNSIYSSKKMELKDIKTIKCGDLIYPAWSLMPSRDHGGVRVCTDDESNAGFFSRWNFAGAAGMPYWTFIHHRLQYAEGEQETAIYNVDEFYASLVPQVQEVHNTLNNEGESKSAVEVVEGVITVDTYLSFTSAVYNQSSLGFSKDRRGINY